VSVVIPAFRHEEFVSQAIRSATSQTHDEVEILFIDDDSPDRTFEVGLAELRAAGRPFCALRKPNEGGIVNLNIGIQAAFGGWISILASDDYYTPDKLALQVDAGERADADVVLSLVDDVLRDGSLRHARTFPADDWLSDPNADWRRRIIEQHFSMMTQGMLFRRTLFARVGLFSPEIYSEDFDFIVRFFTQGVRRTCVQAAVAKHRVTRAHHELAYFNRLRDAWLTVVRRHAASRGERRRGEAVIRAEIGLSKFSCGYRSAGLVDCLKALARSPFRIMGLVLSRARARMSRADG
jgi:glycosyltransferase involved in cell wall biosynthesis